MDDSEIEIISLELSSSPVIKRPKKLSTNSLAPDSNTAITAASIKKPLHFHKRVEIPQSGEKSNILNKKNAHSFNKDRNKRKIKGNEKGPFHSPTKNSKAIRDSFRKSRNSFLQDENCEPKTFTHDVENNGNNCYPINDLFSSSSPRKVPEHDQHVTNTKTLPKVSSTLFISQASSPINSTLLYLPKNQSISKNNDNFYDSNKYPSSPIQQIDDHPIIISSSLPPQPISNYPKDDDDDDNDIQVVDLISSSPIKPKAKKAKAKKSSVSIGKNLSVSSTTPKRKLAAEDWLDEIFSRKHKAGSRSSSIISSDIISTPIVTTSRATTRPNTLPTTSATTKPPIDSHKPTREPSVPILNNVEVINLDSENDTSYISKPIPKVSNDNEHSYISDFSTTSSQVERFAQSNTNQSSKTRITDVVNPKISNPVPLPKRLRSSSVANSTDIESEGDHIFVGSIYNGLTNIPLDIPKIDNTTPPKKLSFNNNFPILDQHGDPLPSLTTRKLDFMLKTAKSTNPKLLNEVNKRSRSKEDFQSRIVANIESNLLNSLKEINEGFESLVKPVNIETLDNAYPIIHFKRKVDSLYHVTKGSFIPIGKQLLFAEKVVVLYYQAKDLVDKILDGSIDNTLIWARESNPTYQIVMMINGYDQYLQNVKTQSNRVFQTQVMNEIENASNEPPQPPPTSPPPVATTKRKTKKKQEGANMPKISVETLVNKLTELEVIHNVHVMPIKGLKELVVWMKSFSYTICSKYYDPLERNAELSTIGTIKSGSDSSESYLESLKQFKYVVDGTAKTLRDKFGSFLELSNRFMDGGGLGGSSFIRSDVEQNLRKVFMADDPDDLINE